MLIFPAPVIVIPLFDAKVKDEVVFNVALLLNTILSSSTLPGVAPKLDELETERVPPAIPIEPVFVLVPAKVNVPDPTFESVPEPEITPDEVLSLLSPTVSACELAISMLPAPSIEATVSEESTSNVAPEAIETAVLSERDPVSFKVPVLIVVTPV